MPVRFADWPRRRALAPMIPHALVVMMMRLAANEHADAMTMIGSAITAKRAPVRRRRSPA